MKLYNYLREKRKQVKELYPRIKGVSKILKLMLDISPD